MVDRYDEIKELLDSFTEFNHVRTFSDDECRVSFYVGDNKLALEGQTTFVIECIKSVKARYGVSPANP